MYNVKENGNKVIVVGEAKMSDVEYQINEAISAIAGEGRKEKLVFQDIIININMASDNIPNRFVIIFEKNKSFRSNIFVKLSRVNMIGDTIIEKSNEGYNYVKACQVSNINFLLIFSKNK